jgi:hypothetical protein
VAASLQRGDACAARVQAGELRREVNVVIGRVPGALREDLSASANILLDKLPPCVQPTPNTGERKHEDRGKRKGRRKHEGGEKD